MAVAALSFTETMVTTVSVRLLASARQEGTPSDLHAVNPDEPGKTQMLFKRRNKCLSELKQPLQGC